jgi:hypothetical protein
MAKYAARTLGCEGVKSVHKQGVTMNCEAIIETGTVRFAIYPDGLDGPRVIARISEAALRDVFEASDDDDESLIETCETHFSPIEAKALERYRAAPSRPILLEKRDFAVPGAPPQRWTPDSSRSKAACH